MFEAEEEEAADFFLRVALGRFLLSLESGRGRGSRTASAVLGFLAFGGISVTIGFLNIHYPTCTKIPGPSQSAPRWACGV